MKFIAQPFDDYRLGDFLLEGLGSDAVGFVGACAFAQRTGVGYLAAALHNFSRLRPFQLTVGVDLLGTSKEALELLLDSVSDQTRLFVFHNPRATFHPKAFRFEYQDRWEIYVGSGNLTRGGMFSNYEAGLRSTLSKDVHADAVLNQRFDTEFAKWSDISSGTVKELSPTLIKQLADRKLIVSEKVVKAMRQAAQDAAGPAKKKTPIFSPAAVPAPPKLPTIRQSSEQLGNKASAVTSIKYPNKTTKAVQTNFVITAQQTDVGHGQTTPGTPRRAAEYFIPLVALRENADFWKWPTDFETDPTWTKKLDADGRGRMYRRKVPFNVEGQFEWVTMIYNPDKGDLRLYNERLRTSGEIGDVLKISLLDTSSGPLYVAEFVRLYMPQYNAEVSRAINPVRNSPKTYGYY